MAERIGEFLTVLGIFGLGWLALAATPAYPY